MNCSAALDGNLGTAWNAVCNTAIDGEPVDCLPVWFEVAFSEPVVLSGVGLATLGDGVHDVTVAILYEVPLEGFTSKQARTLAAITPASGSPEPQEFLFAETQPVQHIRFTVMRTPSGWQPYIAELKFRLAPARCPVAVPSPSVQLPAAPLPECAGVVVEVVHQERLAFVRGIVGGMNFIAKKFGLTLMTPHLRLGRLVPHNQWAAVPLQDFVTVDELQACAPPVNGMRHLNIKGVCNAAAVRWCGEKHGAVCIPSWWDEECDVKKYLLSGQTRVNLQEIGKGLSMAVKFVESQGLPMPISLQLPSNARWYKEGLMSKGNTGDHWKPLISPALVEVSDRLHRRFLQCSSPSPSVAAVARIAYDAGSRHGSAWELEQECNAKLAWVNTKTAITESAPGCRKYLATDWFVKADGDMEPDMEAALHRCWAKAHEADPSFQNWWWPEKAGDEGLLVRLVAGIDSMERAFRSDFQVFRAFLDIAMLVASEKCAEASHLGSMVATPIRKNLGKSLCLGMKKPVMPA